MHNMKNNYSLLEASKHLKKDAFAKLVQTELSKEKSYCKWIGEKQEIHIQGLTLNRGNFYIGNYFEVQETTPIDFKRPPKSHIVYSAVINPYLPIAKGKFKQKYFSSYYNLTESARYLYLSWLSNIIPTNEVPDELLYFHIWGIQIRLFLDLETTQKDRENLINVLLSIRSEIDGESIIFGYINRIIDVAISNFFVYEDKIFALSNINLREYENVLINKCSEINAEKAFDIFTSVYPNRFSEHLLPYIQSYFKKRFKFRKLKKESVYSPFFDDIEIPLTLGCVNMFIPIGLNCKYSRCKKVSDTQHRKISDFSFKLIWKFRAYEKIVNDTISPFSPLAYFCLPEFIQYRKKEIPEQLYSNLKKMVNKQEVVISYDTFAELWGLNYKGENLKRTHIDIMMFELSKLGYGLIPNYAINNKRISSKEPCVIYKHTEQTFMNIDTNFHRMELLAKLIALVLQGTFVSDADFLLIRTILSKINNNANNLAYLNGYILWLLQKKQTIDKTTKEKIESLSIPNKDLFLSILLTLSSPNGNINTIRVNSLKKILPYLGKEENSIHSLLHQMITSGMDFIVVDKEGKQSEPLIEQESSRTGIKIDNHRLNEYMEQTQESQSILSNIFNEETNENTVVDESNKDILKEILSLLFTKEQWDKDELETICKSKGLMLGSILEEINDYSYSVVDDVVLEDEGDTISVIMDYKDELL